MEPIPLHEIAEKMNDGFSEARCMHPTAPSSCGDRIVSAHTVQKSAGLRAIAENGHVLTTKQNFQSLHKHDGAFVPGRVGVNRASTFQGFCDKHDGEFFQPIENRQWTPTKENAFLFSFRAVAFEAYLKAAAIKINEYQKQMDRGRPFEIQAAIQQQLHVYGEGLKLGLADSAAWKAEYDSAYVDSDYDRYRFAALEFVPVLPIVACGGLHVEYDFLGNQLQRLARRAGDFEHVTLNITASANRSLVVFGWIGSDNGPASQLVSSFLGVPNERKSHSIVRLAFEHFENTYMRETWWNSMTKGTQEAAVRRIRSGLPSPELERGADCLVEDGIDFYAAEVTSDTGLVV